MPIRSLDAAALVIAALCLAGCKCAEQPPHPADGVPKASQAPNAQAPTPMPAVIDAGVCGASSAQDLYLSAYTAKASDPRGAAELFRQVVACTPDDDKYHQKATAWL